MKRQQLTKEQRNSEYAFELSERIINIEEARRKLMLDIAENLLIIFERQLYKDILGDEEATWSAFLAEPSVYFSRNSVYKMFQIGKKYLSELSITKETLSQIPFNRLSDVLSVVTEKNVNEILEQAKQLTPQDWRVVVREYQGRPVEDSCKHNFTTYQICKVCGSKHLTT